MEIYVKSPHPPAKSIMFKDRYGMTFWYVIHFNTYKVYYIPDAISYDT